MPLISWPVHTSPSVWFSGKESDCHLNSYLGTEGWNVLIENFTHHPNQVVIVQLLGWLRCHVNRKHQTAPILTACEKLGKGANGPLPFLETSQFYFIVLPTPSALAANLRIWTQKKRETLIMHRIFPASHIRNPPPTQVRSSFAAK